jgi:hypothetical protein
MDITRVPFEVGRQFSKESKPENVLTNLHLNYLRLFLLTALEY